jgi:hypothetical protein
MVEAYESASFLRVIDNCLLGRLSKIFVDKEQYRFVLRQIIRKPILIDYVDLLIAVLFQEGGKNFDLRHFVLYDENVAWSRTCPEPREKSHDHYCGQ